MRFFCTSLFMLIVISVYCQTETSNWYFGEKANIKFSKTGIEIINDSELVSAKGSSCISNNKGDNLFYSNGSIIYNKDNMVMENGSLLASDNEVLQSSIVIPHPNDTNIFYLVTLKKSNEPPRFGDLIPSGLYYSIIDLSMNNSLGKVTKKNILLTNLVSEKLTAVHANDGESIWFISFGKANESSNLLDTFYSFKINKNGIDETPVKSTIPYSFNENLGALKASPNGKYLLSSNYSNVILTDFNNTSGVVSNVNFLNTSTIDTRPKIHGIEFSQDSNYLYVETKNGDDNIIYQFNTNNLDEKNEIFSSNNFGNYMQLARDGKIYLSTSLSESEGNNYLSVISPPKNSNSNIAGFRENSIFLENAKSKVGLPNFIQSYFRTRILNENGCINEEIIFEIDTYGNISSVEWDFGDGNLSNEINPSHIYNDPGNYLVTAILTINNNEIEIKKNIQIRTPPEVFQDKKILQCDFDNDGFDKFNLRSISDEISPFGSRKTINFYESYDDLINNNEIKNPEDYLNLSNPQIIFAKVIGENGCSNYTEFLIESIFIPTDEISNMYSCGYKNSTTDVIEGSFDLNEKETLIRNELNISISDKIYFYPDYNSAQTLRNEIKGLYTSKSSEVWVRIENSLGCGGIQKFNIIVNSDLKINLNDSYEICYNPLIKPPVILDIGNFYDKYEWKNSNGDILSFQNNFTLNATGDFSLTVYKTENGIECSETKFFSVSNPESPRFNFIDINTENEQNNIVSVSITGNSDYEFSLDNINFFGNSNNYTFTNVNAGVLTIYVKDINNCEESIKTDISVIGFKKYFTPNGDGDNDFWNVIGLDSSNFKSISVHIFDRFGKIIFVIKDFDSFGWDGNYNGKPSKENNYWFQAEVIDNNDNIIKKTGNFSLIRY